MRSSATISPISTAPWPRAPTGASSNCSSQPGKDRILGATIVAANAGELIAEMVLAMKHGIGLNKISAPSTPTRPWPKPTNMRPANGRRRTSPSGCSPGSSATTRWRRGMTRIVIFAKAPVPGRVKTRLIPALGETARRGWRAEMLDGTVAEALATRAGGRSCAPIPIRRPQWHEAAGRALALTAQGEGDLGERLARAARRDARRRRARPADRHRLPGARPATACARRRRRWTTTTPSSTRPRTAAMPCSASAVRSVAVRGHRLEHAPRRGADDRADRGAGLVAARRRDAARHRRAGGPAFVIPRKPDRVARGVIWIPLSRDDGT